MAAPIPLTPELLIHAYRQGVFPMARSRHGAIDWYSPDPRAILPLDAFHASHSLGRRSRSGRYVVTRDVAFHAVISACSEPRPYQKQTWINPAIIRAYAGLHAMGVAHSVESWLPRDEARAAGQTPAGLDDDRFELVGGLYGVALGGAFFGESMFSKATDASKVCLVHLVEHLRERGFVLLDVQCNSPHMARFGTIDVPREEFLAKLEAALEVGAPW
ncbi:MAG: leucyl/phenylalanyl-tRNA--protein transferase [Planctomycetota bacterium]|nr:leucyl/phenylalanyl-tRNA--protein transferase [Planctomycetota bacterium]